MSIAFITSFSDQVGRPVFFLNSPFDGIAAAAFMGEVNGCRLMYPNISFSPALRGLHSVQAEQARQRSPSIVSPIAESIPCLMHPDVNGLARLASSEYERKIYESAGFPSRPALPDSCMNDAVSSGQDQWMIVLISFLSTPIP